jgi:hypothetical protein
MTRIWLLFQVRPFVKRQNLPWGVTTLNDPVYENKYPDLGRIPSDVNLGWNSLARR